MRSMSTLSKAFRCDLNVSSVPGEDTKLEKVFTYRHSERMCLELLFAAYAISLLFVVHLDYSGAHLSLLQKKRETSYLKLQKIVYAPIV